MINMLTVLKSAHYPYAVSKGLEKDKPIFGPCLLSIGFNLSPRGSTLGWSDFYFFDRTEDGTQRSGIILGVQLQFYCF